VKESASEIRLADFMTRTLSVLSLLDAHTEETGAFGCEDEVWKHMVKTQTDPLRNIFSVYDADKTQIGI
jgi:hypothetical protein